ncbi:AsmA-like C-terminal region-containing protein [Pasteurellaceae bacterium LIM206]|nr:AsmA-like C-terminal region-containing protein [Pasteurellaceae bacterium LIM206]
MWKKAVIALLAAIIIACGVIYVQKEKMAARLTQLLTQQGIEVERLDFHFLPLPGFTAQNITYCLHKSFDNSRNSHKVRCFFFENSQLDFKLFSALIGNFMLDELRLTNGRLQMANQPVPDYQQIQFSLKPHALNMQGIDELMDYIAGKPMQNEHAEQWIYEFHLTGTTAVQDQFSLASKLKLLPAGVAIKDTDLAYNNGRNFTARIDTGYIKSIDTTKSDYQIHFNQLVVNQQDLGKIDARVLLPQDKYNRYVAAFTSSACRQCTSNFEYQDLNVHTKHVQFSTVGFPAEKLLGILKLPVLLSGNANLQANVTLSDLNPTEGKVTLNIENGKIKGLNLLALVSQYLPINYDEDKVRDAETEFYQYRSAFGWVGEHIHAENIAVQTKELAIKGTGYINLAEMKCDINMNIGLNNEKYKSVALPIHFFDHCASPQYKVEITPAFKKQLKQFLKDRLK